MYVIPAPGLTIIDPDRKDLIPPEGREVPDQPYWYRRVADRDVSLGEPPVEAPAPRARRGASDTDDAA